MSNTYQRRFRQDQSGATSIEYGLLGALLAVAIIAVLSAVGPHLRTALHDVGTDMATPPDVAAG